MRGNVDDRNTKRRKESEDNKRVAMFVNTTFNRITTGLPDVRFNSHRLVPGLDSMLCLARSLVRHTARSSSPPWTQPELFWQHETTRIDRSVGFPESMSPFAFVAVQEQSESGRMGPCYRLAQSETHYVLVAAKSVDLYLTLPKQRTVLAVEGVGSKITPLASHATACEFGMQELRKLNNAFAFSHWLLLLILALLFTNHVRAPGSTAKC